MYPTGYATIYDKLMTIDAGRMEVNKSFGESLTDQVNKKILEAGYYYIPDFLRL
jgi:hypothetical protein